MIKETPRLDSPFLIAGWSPDGGEIGWRTVDYLRRSFSCKEFAEIEPLNFFSLSGVQVQDNVIQFPRSKFYSCEEKNLILFMSSQPNAKGYQFLNLVLDMAEQFKVQEICTVGGLISMVAHTGERKMLAVLNGPEPKKDLEAYDLGLNLDYQGTPSMNGFLLWAAKKRNIAAAGYWVNIPFYLSEKVDPKADKAVLGFLNQRFGLNLDLQEFDQAIAKQEEEISQIRKNNPEVNEYMTRLENNWGLTQEQAGKLLQAIDKYFS